MTLLRKYIRQILLENINASKGISLLDFPDYEIGKGINISKALEDPLNNDLRQHVWSIINKSYSKMEGGNWYPTPESLMGHGLNSFLAHDITGNGIPDVIFAGWVSRRSSYGMIKTSVSGTNGDPKSIAFYKKELVRRTISGEAFHEVSGAPAAILMKAGLRAWDEDEVVRYFRKPKRIFYNKHPQPNSRDAKNAMRYGPNGEYDKWFGRDLKGTLPIVKLFFGKIPR